MDTRSRLQKMIGRTIPDPVWEHLKDHEYFPDSDPGDLQELAKVAKALLRLTDRMLAVPRAPSRRHLEQRAPTADGRAAALNAYWTLDALRTKRVARFRNECFGGEFLTQQYAAGLATCRPAAVLTPSQFRSCGLPPEAWFDADIVSVHGWSYVVWRTSHRRLQRLVRLGSAQVEAVRLLKRNRDDSSVGKSGTRSSVLGRLRRLCEWIARRYGWEVAQARYVILCGIPPFTTPADGQIVYSWRGGVPRARFVIEAEPTAPIGAITNEYRHLRARMFSSAPRTLSSQALKLFRFVIESQRLSARQLSWQQLMERWNIAFPNKPYRDRRRFRRDYIRTELDVIASPIDDDAIEWVERELTRRDLRSARH